MKLPPFLPAAYIEFKTSGAPLANAISDTAATAGLIFNLVARSAIPSDKYLSAIYPTKINSTGNNIIITTNITIAFSSMLL